MTALLAWIWAPLALYGLVLGIGLLADALTRTELPPALLAPVGMAVATVLATLGYRLGEPVLVPAAVVCAAVAGFVLARKRLRERLSAPPALVAGAAVYVLYMAPVALSGEATWAGYNFVNDTATNFILTDLLEHHGAVASKDTSGAALTGAYLVGTGYPLGSFSLLAAVRPLTGVPLESVYQPLMSLLAALAAMSLTEIARRSGLRAVGATVAGALPMGGVLLYSYALHGALKEVALVALLATAVALAGVAVERRLDLRLTALVVVVCLAMILVFSAAAGAYALALGLATLVVVAVSPHRPSLRHVGRLAGVVAVVGIVVLAPVLGSSLDYVGIIQNFFSASDGLSTARFGQLVRPLPLTEAAGVWVSRDYRFPSNFALNPVLVAAAIAAAAAGLVVCVRGRRHLPLVLLATVAIPALALSPLSSPYIDAKLLLVLTPAVVFLALVAALTGLQARQRAARILGLVALLAVGGGVLASDLYSYRAARLAPLERVESMKDVAEQVPDRGLYMLNEWEEYGKYFMRSARVNPASEEASLRPVRLRRKAPIFGQYFDLDEHRLRYVQRFAGIITRRSPVASRPPASFRMIYRNEDYELWRRDPGITVKEHLPLQALDRATAIPDCRKVRALADQAQAPDRLVAARRPPIARLSPFRARIPDGWRSSPEIPRGTVVPNSFGSMTGTLTAGGERRVWLKATGGRPYTVLVDRREVGEVQEINTPEQWLQVDTVGLSAGAHKVEVRRAAASWPPGDAVRGYVGALVLEPTAAASLVSIRPRDADRLCSEGWDWIELVRGST